MLSRAITIGVALLVAAMPVAAQQRGTVEFGGFAASTSFDNSLSINDSWGGGARVGAFLHSRWSLEFEGNGTTATRPLGLADVNVGILSGRLTFVPLKLGRLSVVLGAGVDHTDTHTLESYGFHGLLGAKFALARSVALRVDGIQSHMANGDGTNMALHLGLSVFRNPRNVTTTVTRTEIREVPGPQRPDSVSAAETRRLRELEIRYQRLRDSIANAPRVPVPAPAATSADEVATMHQMIYFRNDRSDLSDTASSILRDKVMVFRSNPDMRIVIVGFASKPGTEAYNMALGLRRAAEAKAYLVSQGIDPVRIEIATRGEGQLMVEGLGEVADASNRRGQFRILVADPQVPPRK